MAQSIRLIVGLGNPGPEYDQTRHNAGFWFVEALARHYSTQFSQDTKYKSLTARLPSPHADTRLLMPLSFMNRSGQAVGQMAQFYKIQPEEILVVHDELDLPVGTAKFKLGGGHGGHNGLKDIIKHLGNQNNFHRLRLGIGHPGHSSLVTGYVLGKPPQAELASFDEIIYQSIKGVELALANDWQQAKQSLHSVRC